MKKQSTLFLAAFSVAVAFCVPAQPQDTSSQGATQSQTGNVDCSDPLTAQSSQCQGQSQQTMQNPLVPGYSAGQTAVQPAVNGNYNDYGNLSGENLRRYQLNQTYPPEPLTEFQKFAASTTGQVLPIFGADLFRQVPSTFAPLSMVPVPPDYTIGPGDQLRIRVWGQVNFQANVAVDRSGDVYLPQVGEIHVAGLPYSELHEHLHAAIGRVYRNFDLTADVGQIRAIQVYVTGEARRPGLYTISSLSTLVDALFASGGPSPVGSMRDIEVRRQGKVITDFDLYGLLIHGDRSKDVPLQTGDVIFIPPIGPQVAVTGSVRNPAIYELRPGETLADALADAGGVSAVAAETQVSIERIDDHRDRFAMNVAYDAAGLGTKMADGDLVQVLSILPKYQKTVILRGNTANPGRFAWHPGMRLSDLIPDKYSLVTRNYWWKRAELGLPTPEFEPLQNFPNLREPSVPLQLPRSEMMGPPGSRQYPTTSREALAAGIPPENPAQAQTASPEQNIWSPLTPEQNAPGNSAPMNGQMNDQSQQPNQQQGYDGAPGYGNGPNYQNTNGYPGQQGMDQRQQPASNSSLAAQSAETGFGSRQQAPRNTVGPIAPEIDWNYAVIERQDPTDLKTKLIPFDLGKLVLDHDPSQDMELQPGDVVTIFSQADIRVPLAQQTKYVRLEGEFVHAGVYTVKPGETLPELVRQAGGFTSSAYLYGSEFTRLSTQRIQQSRMDEYLQSLQMEMERGNLALAASPASGAAGQAAAAASQSSEQMLISRLSRMRATGRIVLQFKPASNGLDSLPDIALENGDRFVVPPIPASVNVVGAVYDQNSFLYASGNRAGYYLHLAGGPDRDADRRNAFIIRADGSVVSRAAARSIWGDEFDNLKMNPGDTIVFPEKTAKPSSLYNFLEWSQLFSQFALGAAALTVIQ